MLSFSFNQEPDISASLNKVSERDKVISEAIKTLEVKKWSELSKDQKNNILSSLDEAKKCTTEQENGMDDEEDDDWVCPYCNQNPCVCDEAKQKNEAKKCTKEQEGDAEVETDVEPEDDEKDMKEAKKCNSETEPTKDGEEEPMNEASDINISAVKNKKLQDLFSMLGDKGYKEGEQYDLVVKGGKTMISTKNKEIKKLIDEFLKQGEE